VYEYLRGEIVSRAPGSLVLEAGGIGYRLLCSTSTLSRLSGGGPVRVLTHLVVREDRHELFGFAEAGERHLFRQLLLVSGVGPSAALGLLSVYEPELLASQIAAGDLAALTRAKGIGKRTAERIVVELRDRLRKEGGKVPAAGGAPAATGVRADAVLALCSLGLTRAEAEERIGKVRGDDAGLEELVRRALK
jgi:Holliday junction DNA helicase RuvA